MGVTLAHYSPLIAAVISFGLAVIKGVVWWQTNSLSVQASLIDSTLDAILSCINFLAIRTAMSPPDACHRFGHDKVEALSSLFQALIMVGLAAYIIWEGALRYYRVETIDVTPLSLWVMGISTVVAIGLVLMQRIAYRHTGSLAIQADALHYQADAMVNSGVWLALLIAHTSLDIFIALGIAFYMAKSAWQIGKKACDILMDRELDNKVQEHIRSIVLSHPAVRALHVLRTRFSGHREFIQLHIVLDGDISLTCAHDIAHEIEDMLKKDHEHRDITIHQEPFEMDKRNQKPRKNV